MKERTFQQAVWLHRAGQLDEAVAAYRRVLEAEPGNIDAHLNLGDALRQTGKLDEAIEILRTAATLHPYLPAAWAALGAALLAQGPPGAALGALRRAVELRPEDGVSCRRLADTLLLIGKPAEAVSIYEQAACLNPRSSECWYGMGRAHMECGRTVEAIRAFRQCTSLDPHFAPALHDLGQTLFQLGCLEEAMPLLRRAAETGCEEVRTRALENLAIIVPGSPTDDNQTILETRRAWGRRFQASGSGIRQNSANTATAPCGPKSTDFGYDHLPEPVRIGYVSSFFHRANWMKPVWALINHHDRSRFRVHLFSDAPADRVQSGYQPHPSDRFHDLRGQSNEAAAATIAAHAIDILVDLNGYSAPPRLGLYPLRPAPILVGWFNLYATSGLACFDYLIGDEHVIPAREEPYYAERILRVPHCYLTFQVDYPVSDVAPPPVLATGQLTIGCLASQHKITDHVVQTWAEVLRRSPGVRLLIRNATLSRPEHQDHLAERFARQGISRERLCLEGPAEHYEFLQTYDRIDLALDTFPYSGGTTTMEALWQGVPVVTFDGDRWASRTSVSLLRAAGLDEFVGRDRAEYLEICVRLATVSDGPARLQAFRAGIRERLRNSPVCDAASFARAMEALYLGIPSPRK